MTAIASRRLLAVLLAVLAVTGAGIAGVAAAADDGSTAESDSERPTPADEIYVEENGDAVLVYESEVSSSDGPSNAEYGVDVGSNLLHALVTDPVEQTPSVRGEGSLSVVPPTISGSGSLSAPAPDAIEAFSLDLSGQTTASDARADGDLSVTIAGGGMMAQLVQSAETSGSVTTAADRLQASGEFRLSIPFGAGPGSELSYALSGSDGTYTLEISQSQPITGPDSTGPDDREAARQMLEETYGRLADDLGGDATVTLDEFQRSDTGEGERLDLAYTASFENVGDGLGDVLREEFAGSNELDEEQAERLASELLAVDIETAELSVSQQGGTFEYAFDLDVRNYADLTRSYFEIARVAAPEDVDVDELNRSRADFEARQAAELERTNTWEGELSHPDEESTRIDLQYSARTTNYGAYVDEREARDLPTPESDYELSGNLNGDRLSVEGDFEHTDAAAFETIARQYAAGLEESSVDTEFGSAIDDVGFQRAKVDAAYDGDGFELEAAAELDDLAALRDAVADRPDVPNVSSVVSRLGTDNESATVVRVSDAVSGDASASDVRSLAYVTDDTTVHLPGEWDREFPEMDTEEAESFLDEADAEGAGVSLPGFGLLVAVIALVSGVALLARRD